MDAIKDLADQLQVLLAEELLPMLRRLPALGPDLYAILESLENLGRRMRGLLGADQPHPTILAELQDRTDAPGTTPQ